MTPLGAGAGVRPVDRCARCDCRYHCCFKSSNRVNVSRLARSFAHLAGPSAVASGGDPRREEMKAPKRPTTAFFAFCREQRPLLAASRPELRTAPQVRVAVTIINT
eukprot:802215-Prorocentrum_minimum.AAC.1